MYTNGGDAGYTITDAGLSNIVDGASGQYTGTFIDNLGVPYVVGFRQLNGQFVTRINFSRAQKVYGIFQAFILLRDGNVFYGGADYLNLNGGNYITTPIQLSSTKKIIDISCGLSTSLSGLQISGIASDSTVWRWTSRTPSQVTFTGNKALKIAHVGPHMFVVETATDLLTWGSNPKYLGLPWGTTTPTSIKKQYTDAGCVFPLKQLVGSYTALDVIDANNNKFGQGEAAQGELGIGIGYDWKTAPVPYNWSWDLMMYKGVTQMPGKWKNLCSGNSMTFYRYAQNINDDWFSWGRGKSRVLGNGVTLSISLENIYPNGLQINVPSYVTPISQSWRVINMFDVNNPPVLIPVIFPKIIISIFDNKTWLNGVPATIPNNTKIIMQLLENGSWIML